MKRGRHALKAHVLDMESHSVPSFAAAAHARARRMLPPYSVTICRGVRADMRSRSAALSSFRLLPSPSLSAPSTAGTLSEVAEVFLCFSAVLLFDCAGFVTF